MLRRGSFSLWLEYSGQVLAADLEFFAPEVQPVRQYICHKSTFLLCRVVLAALEEQPLTGVVQRPGAHGEAELNVGFYLSGMCRAVEKPKFYRTLSKESVEVDPVIPAGIVMLMVNSACVPVIDSAVPNALQTIPCLFSVFLHGL